MGIQLRALHVHWGPKSPKLPECWAKIVFVQQTGEGQNGIRCAEIDSNHSTEVVR